MRNSLRETTVIFFSVIKWSILSTIVGVAVGLSTTVFLKTLNWSISTNNQYTYYYLFLPFALFFSAFIVKYLSPDAEGHGTEKVIEAIHQSSGRIKPIVIPVKLIASVITIAFGGSSGKEGPCVQIGGGVSSVISDILRLDDIDRKKLVICGISAGFSSVFGTPIAGAIFGIEVLFIGCLLYDVLLPSFIAGIVSYYISSFLGITYFYGSIKFVPVLSEFLFVKTIFAGIFFGIVSFITIEAMQLSKDISDRIRLWSPLKGLIGGFLLIILTFTFSTKFLGLGLETIKSVLQGGSVLWYFFILKIIFTAITLNFGGSGGLITPIIFIGATSGMVFSNLLGLDRATLSAIGLVSVLAGTTNTPIASSIMAIELFGPSIGPYAALSCTISYLMTGYRSIYPSQIIGIVKSTSVQVEIGKEVSESEPKIQTRRKTLTNLILGIIRKLKNGR
ncbi:MAG: chloride channel protein [Candidatus Omnitrophica bacterium]|nr:chloride channel protein [Candidatus Omnitrophota bacterium]